MSLRPQLGNIAIAPTLLFYLIKGGIHGQHFESVVGEHVELFLMFVLVSVGGGCLCFLGDCGGGGEGGCAGAVVDERRLVQVQELAPVSVFAAAVVLEIHAHLRLVVLVNLALSPELLLSVGEGALRINNPIRTG
jgi:hypothetical protein